MASVVVGHSEMAGVRRRHDGAPAAAPGAATAAAGTRVARTVARGVAREGGLTAAIEATTAVFVVVVQYVDAVPQLPGARQTAAVTVAMAGAARVGAAAWTVRWLPAVASTYVLLLRVWVVRVWAVVPPLRLTRNSLSPRSRPVMGIRAATCCGGVVQVVGAVQTEDGGEGHRR